MINNDSNTSQSSKSFWKEYWYVWLLIGFFILLVVSYVLRILTPSQNKIPIQDNTWQGITPGYSSFSQLKEILGQPAKTESTTNGLKHYFSPSNFKTVRFNQVIVDKQNKVQFIKELVPFDEKNTLETYTDQWGQYDLKLNEKGFSPSVFAYVFLNKGVVIFAHVKRNVIEEKWYFVPTTKEQFLASWGSNLSDSGSQPEPAQPQ